MPALPAQLVAHVCVVVVVDAHMNDMIDMTDMH